MTRARKVDAASQDYADKMLAIYIISSNLSDYGMSISSFVNTYIPTGFILPPGGKISYGPYQNFAARAGFTR